MLISNFCIKRPLVTVVITLALMALGWIALKNLRVNERPDIAPPILQVNIPYPGASPEIVEREILDRLEKAMRGIPDVTDMRAWANEGSGGFRIEFDFKKSLIEAADEIRNSISSVRHNLPNEMREPIIQRLDPDAIPIMSLSLSSSSQSHIDLSMLAEEQIGDRLRSLPGVAAVNISGDLKRELSVLMRAEKLRMHNISIAEVHKGLLSQNVATPGGKLEDDLESKSIRLLGRLSSPEEFASMVIRRNDSDVVRLGDVAEVTDGTSQPESISFFNGAKSIGISVVRTPDASTVAVAKAVRDELVEIRKGLQQGTQIEIANDGGEWAEQSLNNVIESLILGAILTIFFVYIFLNSWRSTLITALALPTSVLTAFIVVWLFGFTLNFMTLLGLSLAIGVLIDDAIVVRENIVQHMERGIDRVTASYKGTKDIGLAVLATTLSIVAVFVPVAFMDGTAGQWFKPFALTVVASVLVSLIVSFSLDPMLSAHWGDPVLARKDRHGLTAVLDRFNVWFDNLAGSYTIVIRWALDHRQVMCVVAIFSFVLALGLQASLGGTSFLPSTDNGKLTINIRLPSGSSLEYARIKTAQAAELARQLPEVNSIFSNVTRNNSRIDLDIGKSKTRDRSAAEIAKALRAATTRLVGAEYTVQEDTTNTAEKPVKINFYGEDIRILMQLTSQFMDDLGNVKGAVDIGLQEQDPMPEIQVELNRSLANNLGILVDDAAQALRVAFAGIEVGDWVDPRGQSRDVALRLHPDDRVNVAALARLPLLPGSSSSLVSLEQIATLTMDKAPSRINHTNGMRTITVTANVEGLGKGAVIEAAMKLARAIDFPPGYGSELRGSGKDQQEVFGAMCTALIFGVGLMYFILAIQFNSFFTPIPIMINLPLSLIGVVIALIATRHTLNLMSFIGIIMLMGLVAKNAILLLDCTRNKEQEGVGRKEALILAGRLRLRPIMMTTFALIAGMLPVAIGLGEGGEFYQPLAVAIIGGTITSTILTLLMIPTFYDSIESSRERLIIKFNRRVKDWGVVRSIVLTFFELILTVLFVRFIYHIITSSKANTRIE